MTAASTTETTVLSPNYRLPLALVGLSVPLLWLQLWVGVAIATLGLFLVFQTWSLRLHFTATAFEVYRGEQCLRHFPYADWQNWEIFWSPVPILFYFREVKSIHFLPIIFSPAQLRQCLEEHRPKPTI